MFPLSSFIEQQALLDDEFVQYYESLFSSLFKRPIRIHIDWQIFYDRILKQEEENTAIQVMTSFCSQEAAGLILDEFISWLQFDPLLLQQNSSFVQGTRSNSFSSSPTTSPTTPTEKSKKSASNLAALMKNILYQKKKQFTQAKQEYFMTHLKEIHFKHHNEIHSSSTQGQFQNNSLLIYFDAIVQSSHKIKWFFRSIHQSTHSFETDDAHYLLFYFLQFLVPEYENSCFSIFQDKQIHFAFPNLSPLHHNNLLKQLVENNGRICLYRFARAFDYLILQSDALVYCKDVVIRQLFLQIFASTIHTIQVEFVGANEVSKKSFSYSNHTITFFVNESHLDEFYTIPQLASIFKFVCLYHGYILECLCFKFTKMQHHLLSLECFATMCGLPECFKYDLEPLQQLLNSISLLFLESSEEEDVCYQQRCNAFANCKLFLQKETEELLTCFHVIRFNSKNQQKERILCVSPLNYFVMNYDFTTQKIIHVKKRDLKTLSTIEMNDQCIKVLFSALSKKNGSIHNGSNNNSGANFFFKSFESFTPDELTAPLQATTSLRKALSEEEIEEQEDAQNYFTMININTMRQVSKLQKSISSLQKSTTVTSTTTSDALCEFLTCVEPSQNRILAYTLYIVSIFASKQNKNVPLENPSMTVPYSLSSLLYNSLKMGMQNQKSNTHPLDPSTIPWNLSLNSLYQQLGEEEEEEAHLLDLFLVEYQIVKSITSKVFLYQHKSQQKKVVLKQVSQEEITIAMSLQHETIVTHLEWYQKDNIFYLVMEYLPFSLEELLSKPNTFSPLSIKSYIQQIVCAMEYMHLQKQMMHRDLKSDNILIDESLTRIKLCDFGSSASCKKQQKIVIGSIKYQAPEMKLEQWYDEKVDIYSLGIVLLQMQLQLSVQQLPCFANAQQIEQFCSQKQMEKKHLEIILKTTAEDPQKRPSIQEVKQWIQHW